MIGGINSFAQNTNSVQTQTAAPQHTKGSPAEDPFVSLTRQIQGQEGRTYGDMAKSKIDSFMKMFFEK